MTTEPRLRAQDLLAAFLARLPQLGDDDFVHQVPGLPGTYRAGQIRDGMSMRAVVVAHDGMGLSLSANSDLVERWFNRMERAIQGAPMHVVTDHPALPLGDRFS